jgi:hypothetical protein
MLDYQLLFQKCFITYNLKINGNILYPILLIEVSDPDFMRKTK